MPLSRIPGQGNNIKSSSIRRQWYGNSQEGSLVMPRNSHSGVVQLRGLDGLYIVAGLETASLEVTGFDDVWISKAHNRVPQLES